MGGETATWTLDDGEERHREAPDTFPIPDAATRGSLEPGRIVKLIFRISVRDPHGAEETHVERMWVGVEGRDGDGYVGSLDNDPYCTDAFGAGARVAFEPRHVIAVYEG